LTTAHGSSQKRNPKLTTKTTPTLAAQMAIIHDSLFQNGVATRMIAILSRRFRAQFDQW
jgi:hypothetical protein